MSYISNGFRLAKAATQFSTFHSHKLGAVIMRRRSVIAVGWNGEKENPLQKKYNRYRGFDVDASANKIHAECMAVINLIKTDIDPRDCDIFIYREHKNGNPSPAKPCIACMKLLQETKINNIYYTISENEYGCIKRGSLIEE